MLVPSSTKEEEGEKFGLNCPYNVKPNFCVLQVKHFVLALLHLKLFSGLTPMLFLLVTSTADKEVSVSRGISNNVWLRACHYSLIYKNH